MSVNTLKSKTNPSKEIVYQKLSYHLVGIFNEVHNQLGPGFPENYYENALIEELNNHGISFEQQKVINVQYKGKIIGVFRLDLVVDNSIIIELKAVSEITDLFKKQLRSYLKAADLCLGILVNFGKSRVKFFRIIK
jgi:GxxExxY protein